MQTVIVRDCTHIDSISLPVVFAALKRKKRQLQSVCKTW